MAEPERANALSRLFLLGGFGEVVFAGHALRPSHLAFILSLLNWHFGNPAIAASPPPSKQLKPSPRKTPPGNFPLPPHSTTGPFSLISRSSAAHCLLVISSSLSEPTAPLRSSSPRPSPCRPALQNFGTGRCPCRVLAW